MANFEAQYMVLTGTPMIPETDMMLTMWPVFLLIIWGSSALTKAICDKQFVFIMYSQVENSVLTNSSLIEIPPLLTRMSMGSLISDACLRHSSGLLKSIWIVYTRSPAPHSCFTLSSSFRPLAAMMTLAAPSLMNRFAISSPIPELPPVMRTVLPLKRGSHFAQIWVW